MIEITFANLNSLYSLLSNLLDRILFDLVWFLHICGGVPVVHFFITEEYAIA